MEPLQVGEPSYVSYNNYLYEIAALILELHERAIKCNTEFTRYEQVMSIDARMREIAIQARPRYFDVTVPLDRDWPWFIPWARRSLTICFAHKVIIIHRSFLARSFENATFSFSRRTCIAAAKTILNEANQQQDVNEPVIWIDQAFCIAAAITLSVDAIHRHPHELELEVHRKLVHGCINRLREYHNSPLAERGIRLLGVLLLISDPTRATNTILQRTRLEFDISKILAYAYRGPSNDTVHLDAFLSPICPDSARSGDNVDNEMRTQYHVDAADLVENSVPELFPAQSGFSNAFIFEELLARI
ncbi:hypothetical protein LTS08_003656 [Lithohypha guttulata]|nr:hypothetical protein LTS08_003656 [Lithohypha guttulata]